MTGFRDHVPLPPLGSVNIGLSACRQRTMLARFGAPGALTSHCSDPIGPFASRVRLRASVGPFKVSGLDYAVESLRQALEAAQLNDPDLVSELKNDGMLCVRARRHNPGVYSNHSWGTAIDLFFGENDIEQGTPLVQRGILKLVPYLNAQGWYWGGGFSDESVDSMHFELADETILRLPDQPLFAAALPLAGLAPPLVPGGPEPVQIGLVAEEWNYKTGILEAQAAVRQWPDTRASFFMAKLAVDADGAPRAYHPDDEGSFDYLANLSVSDRHGIQGEDAVGPAPGFVVSATSLHKPHGNPKDASTYVDASTIPYIVLPRATYPKLDGMAPPLGCVALVVDTKSWISTGAIFADVGRTVGEGSIALATRLGLNPFSRRHPPKVIGFDDKRFFYLVFPDVTVAYPWAPADIQAAAEAAFAAWGGQATLARLFPEAPALRAPVTEAPLVSV